MLAILHKNLMYYYDILKNTIHDQLLKEYNDHLYNKNMEIQFKTKKRMNLERVNWLE